MQMYSVNIPGFTHKGKSQDYVSEASRRGIKSMCLCDGAGSYRFTDVGARRLSKRLAGYVAAQYYNLSRMTDEEAARCIVRVILECVEGMRRMYGCYEPNAFASTAIVCAVNALDGRYIGFHLGDGLMAVVNSEGTLEALTPSVSYGEGDFSRATVLSTAKEAMLLRDLRVVRGRTREGLLLASDGAKDMLYYPKLGSYVSVVGDMIFRGVKSHSTPQIAEKLMEQALKGTGRAIMDDLSVGVIVLNEHPTARKQGYREDRPLSERRRLNAFGKYAVARDAGLSPISAARQAGWGDKNRERKMAYAEQVLCVR